MKRNLTKCAETGSEILKHHKNYDLTVGEICELLDTYRIEGHENTEYNLLVHAFSAGIAIGRSIEQADKRKKVSYIYGSTNT